MRLSPLFHYWLVVCSLASLVRCTSWTTRTPIPTFNAPGVALSFSNYFFFTTTTTAYALEANQETWIALNPMPTPRYRLAGAVSPYGAHVVSGADAPGTTNSVVHEVYLNNVWTTKMAIPTSRRNCGGASSTTHMWVLGGEPSAPGQTILEQYTFDLDVWTTRAKCPRPMGGPGMEYSYGQVSVIDAYLLMAYVVAPDEWTSKALAPTTASQSFILDCFSCTLTACYIVGQITPTATGSNRFEQYTILTDAWTTLSPLPIPALAIHTAVTQSGVLFAGGHNPFLTDVFSIDVSGSIMGDPLFTSFEGQSHHLTLRTGVFNFFTSPLVVINGLVEHMPHLPPEEDTVVSMIGVVAVLNGCVVRMFTSVEPFSVPTFSLRAFSCSLEDVADHIEAGPTKVFVSTPDVSFVIAYSLIDYYADSASTTAVPSAFLDFFAHRAATAAAATRVGGLLADLSTLGAAGVQHAIASHAYEVAGGCLFAPEVPATATLFGFSSQALAVGC